MKDDDQRTTPREGSAPPRVLLVGYNGKNNTGSEARLLSIIDDVRAVFGEDVDLTVPSLNPENLKRYLKESATVHLVKIPTIYHLALRRLVKRSDLVLLTEGSCYMDTWGQPLLRAFLWVTRCAKRFGVPIIAYAVDTGHLSASNKERVRKDASKTDLIMTRTKAAADRLISYGVTAPLKVTEDTALTMRLDEADAGLLERLWPEARAGVVGFAPVNFHIWPVVVRPWARKERLYQWPYYFSYSEERKQATEDLARHLASEADRVGEKYGKHIAMMSMEGVDETIVRQVLGFMKHADKARMFASSQFNASQMTCILRSLDLLVTSRYHACMLSLGGAVPQVAVGHDVRLEEVYRDLGLSDYFFRVDATRLWGDLRVKIDELLTDPSAVKAIIRREYEKDLAEARGNRILLHDFAAEHGWKVADR